MTPQELINTVALLKTLNNALKAAAQDFGGLLDRADAETDRTDPLSLPLSQAETDHIVTVYTPLYIAALTAIENATDSLGTDTFGNK